VDGSNSKDKKGYLDDDGRGEGVALGGCCCDDDDDDDDDRECVDRRRRTKQHDGESITLSFVLLLDKKI
jgi:hypothetical protein